MLREEDEKELEDGNQCPPADTHYREEKEVEDCFYLSRFNESEQILTYAEHLLFYSSVPFGPSNHGVIAVAPEGDF